MNALFVLLFTLLGAGAGMAHGAALARAGRAQGRWHDTMLARLVVSGCVLAVAAFFGQLLGASLGWLVMFCVSVGMRLFPLRSGR